MLLLTVDDLCFEEIVPLCKQLFFVQHQRKKILSSQYNFVSDPIVFARRSRGLLLAPACHYRDRRTQESWMFCTTHEDEDTTHEDTARHENNENENNRTVTCTISDIIIVHFDDSFRLLLSPKKSFII